jgi:alpha-mannosidase
MAHVVRGRDIPGAELEKAWKLLLLNQFHDIIPGSSIARVYDEALAHHAQVQESARGVTASALAALAGGKRGKSVAVFNSLSWERQALVELPGQYASVTDFDGRELPTQAVGGKSVVEVRVPSCGWTTVTPGPAGAARARSAGGEASILRASRRQLENERILASFNDRGEITSLVDKETGAELADGPCNALALYKDVPGSWDAWDIDSMYGLTPVDLPGKASIEVVDQGPVVARLRITRRINGSDLVQVVSLRKSSRRIDFQTTVEWRESHKLLKVCFPVRYHASDALHEIQFGHIARPTHLSRQFDADRFEVCAHRWTALVEEGRGFAVLNDSKYGVNVLGGSINLTLLRSPAAPDMRADRGTQPFTYALYSWNGSFAASGVVREAAELNCPVVTAPGSPGEKSIARLNSPHVILETMKPAEDGEDDLIVLRLYESMRTSTRCTLSLDLPVSAVEEADMRERPIRSLALHEGKVSLSFRPFEIKTLLVRLETRAAGRSAAPAERGAAGKAARP